MIIKSKVKETVVEEWIDFPTLDSLLAKIDKEDKNTNIRVSQVLRCLICFMTDQARSDHLRKTKDIRTGAMIPDKYNP